MIEARAAVVLAGLLCVAVPAVPAAAIAAPPPSSSSAAASAAPGWKQIYEDGQTVYYISAAAAPPSGQFEVETLLNFKIPQVIGGAQVWSVVSHMKASCDQKRLMTIDNTYFALRMGAGAVVQSQPASDTWHQPEPGSLGELVWSVACGAK
jgi:hypothetical protein